MMANERCEVRSGRSDNEPESYLRDIELAKALSLETLETDRIRREQRHTQETSKSDLSLGKSRISGNVTAVPSKSHKSKSDDDNSQNVSISNYIRPRPGGSKNATAPAIPPPPRRQMSLSNTSTNSSVSSEVPDLISFSSPEGKSCKAKCLEPEFDPLLTTLTTEDKSDVSSNSSFTNSEFRVNVNNTFPQSLSFSLSPSTIVPPLPLMPSLNSVLTVNGPLPLNHWNFPPPFSLNPSSTPVQTLITKPYPSINSSKMPQNSSALIKTIEKKANGNLIDLSFYDRVWMAREEVNSGDVDNKDLLKSFDPLLERAEFTMKEKSSTKKLLGNEIQANSGKPHSSKERDDNTTIDVVQVRRPERLQSQRSESHKIRRNRVYESVKLLSEKKRYNPELSHFKERLVRLRRRFCSDDLLANVGLVISSTLDSLHEGAISVKLAIYSIYTEKPISFACDITTGVEHVISQFICSIYDDISNINLNHYCLKVYGRSEFVSFDSALVDYEFVHRCHKFDEIVRLTALDSVKLERTLARTLDDDESDIKLDENKMLPNVENAVNEKSIRILMETLEREIKRLKKEANKGKAHILQVNGTIQSVKLICTKLAQVETKELRDAISELHQVTHYFSTPLDSVETTSNMEADIIIETTSRCVSDCISLLPCTAFVKMQLLTLVLDKISKAVEHLIESYCRCFYVDFPITDLHPPSHSIKDVSGFMDTLLIQVSSVHRIQLHWLSNFVSYVVGCEVYHGTRLLTQSVETNSVQVTSKFYNLINFEQWVEFNGLSLHILPKESRLCCTLYGISVVVNDGVNQETKTALNWATLPLFNYNGEFTQGRYFCGMWPMEFDKRLGPAVSNISDHHCSVMQLDLPDFGCTVLFPPLLHDNSQNPSQKSDFELLPTKMQIKLLDLVERASPSSDVIEERETLWQMRRYLYEIPQALPKVLLAAKSWDLSCLSDIYHMLSEWKPMSGVDALELLLPCFPDCEVRKIAISWIKSMNNDELSDYLPQLVQALKYETYDTSYLAEFLLERSLTSIRVMHHLYWLLKQNIDDRRCGRRMLLIFNSLTAIAGKAMREHFEGQEELVKKLSRVATRVKDSKDSLRMATLIHELDSVNCDMKEHPACLPLSPSLDVCSLDIKGCNYFTSKTIPLRLSFHNKEIGSAPIEAIFKIGDDLRQDMLTLQMIRIMDKLWLKEGLNLQIVTFNCIPTAFQQGIVELVNDAETLGRIQKEHGLTGPFKDHPIAEWLQKYNTTEREYLKAVENFTYSCAGYSVATYILGICDRHNDNIMIKTSGHLFHIDFGKFLGDCETFGGLKRDRVPFVLTSDMAYVINGGDRPSDKFHHFVDLCCQAFNAIRKHGNLFLNLFALMVSAGIPGVTTAAVNYIQRALLPELTECEAAIAFTRMIEESLKSWFTQFNFFIHNLAQLKFSSEHSSDLLLSFVPRVYTLENDGKIVSVEVMGYEKRYEPEKYYVYVLRVERENRPEKTYLLRSYREFCEFHHKLCTSFPLAKYRNLPKVYIGRSNVRHVAEKRKVEIESFLNSLWKMADEIKHCDLVYTFLHPLPIDLHRESDKKSKTSITSDESLVTGSIKLSIHYKNDTLFVMVLHAKNLSEVKNQSPDTYVKTYLVPDPNKSTKRKTKMVYRNSYPTYMEMITYRLNLEAVEQRTLQVSLWHHGIMSENSFLGAVSIELKRLDLKKQTTNWYQLGNVEKLLQR